MKAVLCEEKADLAIRETDRYTERKRPGGGGGGGRKRQTDRERERGGGGGDRQRERESVMWSALPTSTLFQR